MINFLIGAPGGGKSYEAVVYHILPALKKGRKVITNLPLILDAIAALDESYLDLIDYRTRTKANELDYKVDLPTLSTRPGRFNTFPFSHIEDYGDTWRHPETGAGPLYVIDECHSAIPRVADPQVLDWFAMARHESVDVLLISQSHRKLHLDVQDLVQLVYRVRKAVAFGSQDRYIRKVQDGLRGDVVNTSVRTYQKQYFPLYKSHTRGGGQELAANDVVPIWRRWPFLGTSVAFVVFVVMLFTFDFSNPFDAASHVKPSQPPQANQKPLDGAFYPVASQSPPQPVSTQVQAKAPEDAPSDPFAGKGVHLVGEITFGTMPTRVIFALSQGGQGVTLLPLETVLQAGYAYTSHGHCSGQLEYKGKTRQVVCDAPTVAVQIPLS